MVENNDVKLKTFMATQLIYGYIFREHNKQFQFVAILDKRLLDDH